MLYSLKIFIIALDEKKNLYDMNTDHTILNFKGQINILCILQSSLCTKLTLRSSVVTQFTHFNITVLNNIRKLISK